MASGSEESEVATYVLAYLLQNNMKGTANTFLQECNVLPSKTFIVLPETPLHSIIAEHRARLNAKVLVNTLGREPAWQELWAKLHTTLNQIKYVSEDVNQPTMKRRVAGGGITKSTLPKSPIPISPRKRKQVSSKRIQSTSSSSAAASHSHLQCVGTESGPESSGRPNSPSIQQVLDTFLDDDSFPGKLADIINQCVSSDMYTEDISSEMSSETVERILSATLSEPMLESKVVASPSDSDLKVSGSVPGSSISHHPDEPNHKKTKLDTGKHTDNEMPRFPSEQDIDNFLDQLHQ